MKKIKILSKFNQDLFWSVLVICFFFLSTNALAQEDYKLDLQKSYEVTVETSNKGHGAEADEYNSARSQAVNANTAVANAILFIAPDITVGGDEIQGSATISPDMKGGLYGMASGGVTAMLQSQPLVNVYAHLADEWVPGYQSETSVYAALDTSGYDSGYAELMSTGVNTLWAQVRNLAYVFFVVVMMVVGFMIMFRSKIGGQTLVTLGNALPNVVIALIGVTFSFAIAGLIIDIGGVLMVLLVDIFERSSDVDLVTLESVGSVFKAFVPQGLADELVPNIIDGGSGSSGLLGILGTLGIGATVVGAIVNPATLIVGIVGLVIVLAILGVVTVGVFKVFITLVKAYVGILVNVITGPIQIAMSAIPGKGNNFMNWMLSILRNVLVYPLVFAILNIPGLLYSLSDGGLSLPGPDKLTLAQSANQVNESFGIIGSVMIFILQIFVIFAASKADQYVKAIIPPTTSKAGGDAAGAVKQALSGIPLVGSLIK